MLGADYITGGALDALESSWTRAGVRDSVPCGTKYCKGHVPSITCDTTREEYLALDERITPTLSSLVGSNVHTHRILVPMSGYTHERPRGRLSHGHLVRIRCRRFHIDVITDMFACFDRAQKRSKKKKCTMFDQDRWIYYVFYDPAFHRDLAMPRVG